MSEPLENHLFKDFISYEEFVVQIQSLIDRDVEMVHVYKEMFLDVDTKEKDREFYKELINEYSKDIYRNASILKTATIEREYTAFFMDDGMPCTAPVSKEDRKKIEGMMRQTRLLYG